MRMRITNAIWALAMAILLIAGGPDASNDHLVITNNLKLSGPNTGSILDLRGTRENPTLQALKTLNTNVSMISGYSVPNVVIAQHDSDICIFLADPQNSGNEISAFVYPSYALVGNYNNPAIANSGIGMALAARGNFLFAGSGNNDSYLGDVGVWQVNSGCALQLLSTLSTPYPIGSLAVTPDGKTVVVGYEGEQALLHGADSFSVSESGNLTEHGPYGLNNTEYIGGIDITADSKYALFASTGDYPTDLTAVVVVPINSDGTFGVESVWGGDGGLGPGIATDAVWLSPNEKLIYVNDNVGTHITTLNFTEVPVKITWGGCYTTMRTPEGAKSLIGALLTTAFPNGTGGSIYVVESVEDSDTKGYEAIGLLNIDPSTGCTTEVPASPFAIGKKSADSLAAWPSRPF